MPFNGNIVWIRADSTAIDVDKSPSTSVKMPKQKDVVDAQMSMYCIDLTGELFDTVESVCCNYLQI